ncbi:hypothetical protein NBE98_11085 [Clostridium swellfunianum]|uniref:hypothetical protein n=1 Tax=Clostridium swellfunianum TaxID=1367462 RepID=UPI00202E9C9D|nr:hypothetical protein [Clostridium swellfunianum]MCM0648918.1 hypothetical protein [Clostridium swellfunianum]
MANKIKLTHNVKAIGIIALIGVVILGIFSLPDMQRNRAADNYYKSLIKQEFSKAFNYVLLWDGVVSTPSKYSEEKAKSIYLEKMNRLTKEKDYKIKSANTKIVNRDRMFFIEADVTAEVNGQTIKYHDLLQFRSNNKLFIDYSDDVYSHLRDGKLEGWSELLNR